MSDSYRGGEPVAEIVRSGFAESFHRGSVAVTDPSGNLAASIGDTGAAVFPRSSNKPMQALAMLRAGWEPGSDADLAIACASHRGEPFHLAQVRSVLDGSGIGEDRLQCPPDLPSDPASRAAVLAEEGEPRRIYMNCSGKHSSCPYTA
jgi:L-asparaginase II